MREGGFIKVNPDEIIARAKDWRFFSELKRELKTQVRACIGRRIIAASEI
jgi:hypothetical protein